MQTCCCRTGLRRVRRDKASLRTRCSCRCWRRYKSWDPRTYSWRVSWRIKLTMLWSYRDVLRTSRRSTSTSRKKGIRHTSASKNWCVRAITWTRSCTVWRTSWRRSSRCRATKFTDCKACWKRRIISVPTCRELMTNWLGLKSFLWRVLRSDQRRHIWSKMLGFVRLLSRTYQQKNL